MTGRVGVFSSGVWALREIVETCTGMRPVRRYGGADLRPVDAVLGWGHKATAQHARRRAASAGVPYFAMEDGFIRSVLPGRGNPSLSFVVDRTGIYYDSRGPSDLETLIRESSLTAEERYRAGAFIRRIQDERLSKYNGASVHAPDLSRADDRPMVFVMDQTLNDASVEGALAGPGTFTDMLDAALDENPGAEVAVKAHPEVIAGKKQGYLFDRASKLGVRVIGNADPWSLFDLRPTIYTVSSLTGFEALLAGLRVVCFGLPFYAGWGLCDERMAAAARDCGGRRGTRRSVEDVFSAAYLRYSRYFDPWFRREISIEQAIDALLVLRNAHRRIERPMVTVGFSGWRKQALEPFLSGAAGPPVHAANLDEARRLATDRGGEIVVWGAWADVAPGAAVVRAEDGFLRSVGLGLLDEPPASIVLDRRGIYFDSRAASDFEHIVQTEVFGEDLLARAAQLRRHLVERRITKYNVGRPIHLPRQNDRLRVLVPGQVESDASIRLGSPVVKTNADLLRRVRLRHPDAIILYKPHPDVLTGLRPGRVPDEVISACSATVVRSADIHDCIDWADRIETTTSLTGFEALIRNKPVAVHGQPFYAGWGLTEDLAPIGRRQRRLSIDELVAAALILYPRYLDPVSRLPATPEVIVERLCERINRRLSARDRAAMLIRRTRAYVLVGAERLIGAR